MKQIVLSNLKDRFSSYFRLVIMLTAMIFITSYLLGDLLPLMHISQTYNRLGLQNSVVLTAKAEESKNIKAAVDDCNGKYLGVSFRGRYSHDALDYFQPVEEWYFANLQYKFKIPPIYDEVGKNNSYPAIIVSSLAKYYSVGNTYQKRLSGRDGAEITFTVVGVLKDDFVYLTPAEDTPSSVVSEQSNYIFLISDENDSLFKKRDVYGAVANGSIAEFCNALVKTERVESAFATQGYKDYCALELEISGRSIMLQIISVALCLAGIMSNSVLSMTVFQRKYQILFICGASKSKCRIIQIVTDTVAAAAAVIAFAGLYILALEYNVLLFNAESIFVSLIILVLVFAVSEAFAFAAKKGLSQPSTIKI